MNDNLRKAKHLFMAYRNGIIADSLRKAGMPYNVIFGLQLPQLRQIARQFSEEVTDRDRLRSFAEELWADKGVRESRILALALYPPDLLSLSTAKEMATGLLTREETDLLPFLLLRNTSLIPEIIASLDTDNPANSYLIEALSRFMED